MGSFQLRLILALASATALPSCAASIEDVAVNSTPVLSLAFQSELERARAVTSDPQHTPAQWQQADATLEAGLVNPEFAMLPVKAQAAAFSGSGWGAVRLNDTSRARDRFAEATRLDPDHGWNWKMLAEAELLLEHADAAAAALERYVDRWSLPAGEKEFATRVIRAADRRSDNRLLILQALFDDDWKPDALGASYFWYELAQARASRQESDAARTALGRITSPEYLVRVRDDHRFDGLFDRASPQFDVLRAAHTQVGLLRAQVHDSSEATRDAADLMAALLMAGENAEALALADRILAAPQPADGPGNSPEARSSIAARRATALKRLDQVDKALAQSEQAAAIRRSGQTNVNQTLDLAVEYCSLGRGQDAHNTATSVTSNMNTFGRLVQQFALHCASLLLEDAKGSAQALAYLAEHQAAGPHLYLWALVREHRMDEAAKQVIEALADEQTRSDVLFSAQDFLKTPPSPGDAAMEANWTTLFARKDVRQAIDRVGRIENYDVYAP